MAKEAASDYESERKWNSHSKHSVDYRGMTRNPLMRAYNSNTLPSKSSLRSKERCSINIEILHGRTHSSCHGNNVGKGYWSADQKCGGSHALLECSALHALHLEFGGQTNDMIGGFQCHRRNLTQIHQTMYSSTLDSQKPEMEKVFWENKIKKYIEQSFTMMENNHACQEIENKLKCVRQHLQNLALFPPCTWFITRSRGVRAASAKSR